jgi:magnesium chelatase subunit D
MKLNNLPLNYPFTAIVGQEMLKKALLLCAINPAIGGLLIQGDKGTAKSTAARALAEVVPYIQNESNLWVMVPFINLPIGATEERIIGSLDLEAVLVEKIKKFQPGLLAAVHQGILYIDEVNLLPDHLVDILLDVAAMGENRIEREGLSFSHPSKYLNWNYEPRRRAAASAVSGQVWSNGYCCRSGRCNFADGGSTAPDCF